MPDAFSDIVGDQRGHDSAKDFTSDKSSECPYCGYRVPENDGWAEKAHMEAEHPQIIEERLRKAGLL